MFRCPLCGGELTLGYCPRCGYDEVIDIALFHSLKNPSDDEGEDEDLDDLD